MAGLRLLVHVEGQTEAIFVKEILGPHLTGHGYAKVDARLLGGARRQDRRGGIRNWQRAETVETALLEDIARRMGPSFDRGRFEPFVVMHEYEGLLFSDCHALATCLGDADLTMQLSVIRGAFATPEDINDSSETAPSKRIQALMGRIEQRYNKPFHGVLVFLEVGLVKVRAECPHFDRWVRRLEERVAKP